MIDNAILEIVELPDGEVVLRSTDSDDEAPLVSIRFSEQALELLQRSRFDVAREMIDHAITRSMLWDGDDTLSEQDEEESVTVH
ncbi:hypothetical protein [Zymobacter palmae]|uniref:La protein, smallRNA-binding pol III n=1 Tax=Zymobacter palmae TaxID=33074 RepID=A0A348HGC1_9GAMM|nr:hypothetical protein [Zymobacter palmae]BBG30673.1 La protein, smallRNA-binding pol III [Zymobacter palmae]